MTTDKYLGLDVHKDTIVVALADGGRNGEVRTYGTIPNDLHAMEWLVAKLGGEGVRLHVAPRPHRTLAPRVMENPLQQPPRTRLRGGSPVPWGL